MNALFAYIVLGMIAIFFCLGAMLFSIVFNVIPSTPASHTFLTTLFQWVFGFFDVTFILILIIFVLTGPIEAYTNPNVGMAVLNIILLVFFAFLFLSLRTPILGIATGFNMQLYLPQTYGALNSNWVALFIFVALAVTIVLNFR
jgi:hypothetical protein